MYSWRESTNWNRSAYLFIALLVAATNSSELFSDETKAAKETDSRLHGVWRYESFIIDYPAGAELSPEYLIFGTGYVTFHANSQCDVPGYYAKNMVQKKMRWRAYPDEKPHRLELWEGDKIYLKAIYQCIGDKVVIAFYPQAKLATTRVPKDFSLQWDKAGPPVAYLVLSKD
jgi:hypothetical protein